MMTVIEAFHVIRGDLSDTATQEDVYNAWQLLYDEDVPLGDSDWYYQQKLIDDGVILTDRNRDELGGKPVRGTSINEARILSADIE